MVVTYGLVARARAAYLRRVCARLFHVNRVAALLQFDLGPESCYLGNRVDKGLLVLLLGRIKCAMIGRILAEEHTFICDEKSQNATNHIFCSGRVITVAGNGKCPQRIIERARLQIYDRGLQNLGL